MSSSPRTCRRTSSTLSAGLVSQQFGRLPRRGEALHDRRLRVPGHACRPAAHRGIAGDSHRGSLRPLMPMRRARHRIVAESGPRAAARAASPQWRDSRWPRPLRPMDIWPLAVLAPAVLMWLWLDAPTPRAGRVAGLLVQCRHLCRRAPGGCTSASMASARRRYGSRSRLLAALVAIMAAYQAGLGYVLARWLPRRPGAGNAAGDARGLAAGGVVARLVPVRLSLAVAGLFADRYVAGGAGAGGRRLPGEPGAAPECRCTGYRYCAGMAGCGRWRGGVAGGPLDRGIPARQGRVDAVRRSAGVDRDPAGRGAAGHEMAGGQPRHHARPLPANSIPTRLARSSSSGRNPRRRTWRTTSPAISVRSGPLPVRHIPTWSWASCASTPDGDNYYNSILALAQGASLYDKHHLVPFGEYFPVPQFVRQWLRLMSLPYSDFTPGAAEQPPLARRRPAAGRQHLLRGRLSEPAAGRHALPRRCSST